MSELSLLGHPGANIMWTAKHKLELFCFPRTRRMVVLMRCSVAQVIGVI